MLEELIIPRIADLPIDLGKLAGLTQLRTVEIYGAGPVHGAEMLPAVEVIHHVD